ncbi:hypothetical protein BVRB_034290 [Beta vulgaris subsp. vulgaris]|uniref:Uncharacterized protein n=1 Tax=Beta vulgaris subsp. vulgaris TaxID=3555 RepID=A0A0J7YRK7_BETVV|nr:hypothetical protein BVRB_034290 [Beta vulgaris subsp. vulgaris]
MLKVSILSLLITTATKTFPPMQGSCWPSPIAAHSKITSICMRPKTGPRSLYGHLSPNALPIIQFTARQTWEAGTTNLVGLAFAPNGAFLCAWDGPLYYNVCVYAVPKGERLMAYSAYEDALAIKSVQCMKGTVLAPGPGSEWSVVQGRRTRCCWRSAATISASAS